LIVEIRVEFLKLYNLITPQNII